MKLSSHNFYQQVITTLPDSIFEKLIDTCSISYVVKTGLDSQIVEKVDFKAEDRFPSVPTSNDLLDSSRYRYYYRIFWVPNKRILNEEFTKQLLPREQVAVTMLTELLNGNMTGVTKKGDPFIDGFEYEEEMKPIFCSINTKPAGANIYIVPRYDWDFYLKMPDNFTQASINEKIINRLGKYKLPSPTVLSKIGLSETAYTVILEMDGKYIYLQEFYPRRDDPARNRIVQSFK